MAQNGQLMAAGVASLHLEYFLKNGIKFIGPNSGGGLKEMEESLKLPEHRRVTITIQLPPVENPDEELESWHQVYAGLSDSDVREIESIALDRSHFIAQ